MAEYIAGLTCGDVIPVRITHLEPFGAFADIGCGIVSLLPIDAISVSRIDHPKERFTVGMDIRAVVRMKDENRITLSHRELLGTWTENAERFRVGETVAGIVRSVESYGIFVELTPNLAGLAELKENVHAGQQASVFIKSILPNRMKVKLVLVECFDYTYKPEPPVYFFQGDHIDKFAVILPNASRIKSVMIKHTGLFTREMMAMSRTVPSRMPSAPSSRGIMPRIHLRSTMRLCSLSQMMLRASKIFPSRIASERAAGVCILALFSALSIK